jgi:transposase
VHIRDTQGARRPEEIAALHGAHVSRQTIWNWQRRWRGTARSLEHKAVSGRPRVLSSRQVQQHVRAPILRANRAHRSVRYTKLLPQVQRATGTQMSLRTLRRYGKEEARGHKTRGVKRTAEESECTRTCALLLRSLCHAHAHFLPSSCLHLV